MFSLVIAILIAVAIGIFALARTVAGRTQDQQVRIEAQYLKGVEARVKPFARVAIAGQDNAALAIEAPANAKPAAAAAVPKDGTEAFDVTCKACHGTGIGGAPKAGDHAAWAPRIAKGKAVLYTHALQGFTGTAGMMPAKGGRPDIPDEVIQQAVDHMVEMSQ